MANRYLGIGRLAMHPAFNLAHAALVCPLCGSFEASRTAEYDRHFLAHNPSQADCERWLAETTYHRIGIRKGWFTGCEKARCNRKAEYGTGCECDQFEIPASARGVR